MKPILGPSGKVVGGVKPQRAMRFVVGLPCYRGQVSVGHVEQMHSMVATVVVANGLLDFIGTVTPQGCSIDWSRNVIMYAALHEKADMVLMCDADTYHKNAADIFRMMGTCWDQKAAVIAAPVMMRGRKGYNVQHRVEDHDPPSLVEPETWKGKVIEVDRIGTAMMAVNLAWIRDHWPKQPWFTTRQLEGDMPLKIGEDITFCDRVRDRGGVVLADGRFEPCHVGAE